MPPFLPGLELGRLFFIEAVKPIVDREFPGLRYAAALLGSGSEVLGFDTEMSTDHEWGPRVDLFLRDSDTATVRTPLDEALRSMLPHRLRGYPTSFGAPDPADGGTRSLEPRDRGFVEHKIPIVTPAGFFRSYLGVDGEGDPGVLDWLTIPSQKLRTVSSGAVFHDDIGLGERRKRFAYYPRDVWLYLLAAGWARIGQEEHLMGRAGIVGDEIGSALIGGRLVRDVMRLCFLMERTYAPYAKWFGTAFAQLRCAHQLTPHLRSALKAGTWQERERHLVPAYEIIAGMHNSLLITRDLPMTTRGFFGRPFRVIALHGFAEAILARIEDPTLRRLAEHPPIGSIDQISDNTDLLEHAGWQPVLRRLYE
jgi:hypothetical protein